MKRLILHPTETTQWQALLHEAQAACSLQLTEDLESYLVFLLMRYATHPGLATSVVGVDFLESYHKIGQNRQVLLRDVGDKCLLFSGLFPGHARRRKVKVSYFVGLGQSAYNALSSEDSVSQADLFATLCQDFVVLMDILQATRETSMQIKDLLPLEAAELWHETGSQRAKEMLERYMHSSSIFYEGKGKH